MLGWNSLRRILGARLVPGSNSEESNSAGWFDLELAERQEEHAHRH
jgi:hypothetical protein